ncbi:hypothetical protein F5X99DRAFT_430899 [Biscogniauxia marginata]|nr:hypothetical protein F5X99DRAFT_430899 [Biscogniauxia marginata]
MEAIQRWLGPKHKNHRPKISSPVSGTCKKLTDEDAELCGNGAGALVTTDFVPRDRGRKETIDFLKSCTSDSLARLLREQDRAERQVRRGPKTIGNKEVQNILRRPSRRAVERFHFVRRQAEVAIRYGAPGAAAYNFSRSLNWNKTAGQTLLPSLQLRDPGNRMSRPSSISVAPAGPFTPISWLELPKAKKPSSDDPESLSPISEPGGWRDTSPGELERPESRAGFERDEEAGGEDVEHPELPQLDTDVEREFDPCDDDSHRTPDSDEVCEGQEEWETSEAQVVAIAQIPLQRVREIYVKPASRRTVEPLQPIQEIHNRLVASYN